MSPLLRRWVLRQQPRGLLWEERGAGQGCSARPVGREQVVFLQSSPWISGRTGLTCRLGGCSSFADGAGGPGPRSRWGWGWAGGKQSQRQVCGGATAYLQGVRGVLSLQAASSPTGYDLKMCSREGGGT